MSAPTPANCSGLANSGVPAKPPGIETDAYNGEIRCRKEVSERLSHDVRQGVHARKVMESYQTWFGEGPELSVIRMLGLFDGPADEKVLGVLLKSPAIPGLTESLINLSPTERLSDCRQIAKSKTPRRRISTQSWAS